MSASFERAANFDYFEAQVDRYRQTDVANQVLWPYLASLRDGYDWRSAKPEDEPPKYTKFGIVDDGSSVDVGIWGSKDMFTEDGVDIVVSSVGLQIVEPVSEDIRDEFVESLRNYSKYKLREGIETAGIFIVREYVFDTDNTVEMMAWTSIEHPDYTENFLRKPYNDTEYFPKAGKAKEQRLTRPDIEIIRVGLEVLEAPDYILENLDHIASRPFGSDSYPAD